MQCVASGLELGYPKQLIVISIKGGVLYHCWNAVLRYDAGTIFEIGVTLALDRFAKCYMCN